VGGSGRYQQGVACVSHQGATGSSTQEGITKDTNRQKCVGGFPSMQPCVVNRGYSPQGVLGSGYAQNLADPVGNNMPQQRGDVGNAQQDPVSGYNGGGACSQYQVLPTTQANSGTGRGYPQHY